VRFSIKTNAKKMKSTKEFYDCSDGKHKDALSRSPL